MLHFGLGKYSGELKLKTEGAYILWFISKYLPFEFFKKRACNSHLLDNH